MYESYWQLQYRPFDNTPHARFYYPSEVHQGALLKLRYAIENRSGGALLAGASGTGKSMAIATLERQLPDSFQPFVHVVFPQMPSGELLAYLATELGAVSRPASSIEESVRRIEVFLRENAAAGRHAVLAIDEAHLLIDTRALETMRLLLNFGAEQAPLTLLLVGQPALLPALDRMPGLEERLGVKCLLRPLSLDETVSYVNHRLTAAGARREIFTSEALNALYKLTQGNPRRINRLCDLALLIGYAEEQSSIGSSQIESVCDELVNVAPE